MTDDKELKKAIKAYNHVKGDEKWDEITGGIEIGEYVRQNVPDPKVWEFLSEKYGPKILAEAYRYWRYSGR